MLISTEEFIRQASKKGISRLQIAFLIDAKVISTPLHIQKSTGPTEFFFDDFHIAELEKLLSTQLKISPKTIIKQRSKQRLPALLLEQIAGMSKEVEEIFEHEKSQGKDNVLNQYRFNINDVLNYLAAFGQNPTEKASWFTRFKQRLPRLRYPLGIKFNANDLIRLTVLTLDLSNQFDEFFFFRVRPIDENISRDLCLSEYAKSFGKMNWGMLEFELDLIRKFTKHEIHLKDWSLGKSLDFIQSIEIEYQTVIKIVDEYRHHIDPNNIIANYLAYTQYKQRLFDPAIKRAQEELEVKQKKLETATEKVLEKVFASLMLKV